MTAKYLLKLFISGESATEQAILRNVVRLCTQACGENYELTVIDISLDPQAAAAAQVLMTPTLLRTFPLPSHRLVGDLSDLSTIFSGHSLNGTSNGNSSNGTPSR